MSVSEVLRSEKATEQETKAVRKNVYTPATDLYSNEEEHVLLLDLPGVKEGDLEISIEKDELRISAKTSTAEVKGELRYSEYGTGDYRRSFLLSEPVEEDKITAVLKNGVLQLKLPRKKPLSKKIEVRTS
ncbi:Hsp20/alpha crystallin family protein [Leptospira langatensis]|uniref:Hsp20/alpha crystallin family protein n=1 Tax=Leptospira langatensis TaxID=2484983 RepID=A0A5F1ZQX5_9LEPT|nr:Hsp20/alpha crystallin family protein [Leptospira langatensis]TGK05340.1 Hsp20/alpha crystallin family protein [Leptospira langatensis]TGL38476.1 Hsp20/alpha crystallin family protein [Leptospira langatensis]